MKKLFLLALTCFLCTGGDIDGQFRQRFCKD